MGNITALAIPAIISSGALIYKPNEINFLLLGFIVLFILYISLLKILEKYNLHNLFNIISISLTTFIGLLYLLKTEFYFIILGFIYILFSIYVFNYNLVEYTRLGENNFKKNFSNLR